MSVGVPDGVVVAASDVVVVVVIVFVDLSGSSEVVIKFVHDPSIAPSPMATAAAASAQSRVMVWAG